MQWLQAQEPLFCGFDVDYKAVEAITPREGQGQVGVQGNYRNILLSASHKGWWQLHMLIKEAGFPELKLPGSENYR